MLFVFWLISAEYQNIIEINHTYDIRELSEDFINEGLEYNRSIY